MDNEFNVTKENLSFETAPEQFFKKKKYTFSKWYYRLYHSYFQEELKDEIMYLIANDEECIKQTRRAMKQVAKDFHVDISDPGCAIVGVNNHYVYVKAAENVLKYHGYYEAIEQQHGIEMYGEDWCRKAYNIEPEEVYKKMVELEDKLGVEDKQLMA